jgi:hypothetical protein
MIKCDIYLKTRENEVTNRTLLHNIQNANPMYYAHIIHITSVGQ